MNLRRSGVELDLLVLGSGVAGLSAAVRAATQHDLRTGVITKAGLEQATTRWAQGGVAAALSADPDDVDLHLVDTLAAGAGLCDLDAVRVLVDEGPRRVEELIALGAVFDRDVHGNLELAREGGHSVPRVVHAGGSATGEEIERALVSAVRRTALLIHEEAFVLDLLCADGRCVGVECLSRDGVRHRVRAHNVLLAAGGAGQLYEVTTNPPAATGDGVAMALRAGAAVADVEFYQFHPTALHHPRTPRPLLSEALRGHGAVLRGADHDRFVDELLPRDVVSRAILARMLSDRTDHVWLDCTSLDRFASRFPNIAEDLHRAGLDPARDLLPVAPAAHHLCGGVLTDLDGATSLPGLWAAGEVACTGVHGANRLASNSLLEGMVFGPRAVDAIVAGRDAARATGAMRALMPIDRSEEAGSEDTGSQDAGSQDAGSRGAGSDEVGQAAEDSDFIGARFVAPANLPDPGAGDVHAPLSYHLVALQRVMTADAGVVRNREGLHRALVAVARADAVIRNIVSATGSRSVTQAVAELANLTELARVLVSSALIREESRGTHFRSDHPAMQDSRRVRLVHRASGLVPRGPG